MIGVINPVHAMDIHLLAEDGDHTECGQTVEDDWLYGEVQSNSRTCIDCCFSTVTPNSN